MTLFIESSIFSIKKIQKSKMLFFDLRLLISQFCVNNADL